MTSSTAPGSPPPERRCAICQTALAAGDKTVACPACRSQYHADCWAENRGCAVYGCPKVPKTEGRRALEIPPAYWGQEDKPCPACGATILAAAVRCRYCGATFESGRPQDAREFQARQALVERLPRLRQTTITLFVCCLLPCTAPVAGVAGALWYQGQKDALAALPGLYSALTRLGIVVAVGQTLGTLVAVVLYVLLRAS